MLQRAKFQTALRLIYPPKCISCAAPVATEFGLCSDCWPQAQFIGGAVCDACGVPLPGEAEAARGHCDGCLATPRPWTQGRAALVYGGVARTLVLRLKYADRQDLAQPAAHWMARAGAEILRPDMLIAPIPLHWLRLMKRRYNQSALLGQALGRETGLTCVPDLLMRNRATQSLDGLGRAVRAEMLENAMDVTPRWRTKIAGRPVLLVDDVMTTGATYAEATRALQAAGAGPISVLTLARAANAP